MKFDVFNQQIRRKIENIYQNIISLMLEKIRTKGNFHPSLSLPNFHYTQTQRLNPTHPTNKTNLFSDNIQQQPNSQPKQNENAPNYTHQIRKTKQVADEYQTGMTLRRYTNKLLQSSPYNYSSTYQRFYTEPNIELSDYYNKVNKERFYGLKKLGKLEPQMEKKFNRFEGTTTYKDSYGSWYNKNHDKNQSHRQLQIVCKPTGFSHDYGNQKFKRIQVNGSTKNSFYLKNSGLSAETEYSKHYRNPEDRRNKIFKERSQKRESKQFPDSYRSQSPITHKITGFNKEKKQTLIKTKI